MSKMSTISCTRYINQPEPGLKGHSVTVKADEQKVAEMHEQAAATFTQELAGLMRVVSGHNHCTDTAHHLFMACEMGHAPCG